MDDGLSLSDDAPFGGRSGGTRSAFLIWAFIAVSTLALIVIFAFVYEPLWSSQSSPWPPSDDVFVQWPDSISLTDDGMILGLAPAGTVVTLYEDRSSRFAPGAELAYLGEHRVSGEHTGVVPFILPIDPQSLANPSRSGTKLWLEANHPETSAKLRFRHSLVVTPERTARPATIDSPRIRVVDDGNSRWQVLPVSEAASGLSNPSIIEQWASDPLLILMPVRRHLLSYPEQTTYPVFVVWAVEPTQFESIASREIKVRSEDQSLRRNSTDKWTTTVTVTTDHNGTASLHYQADTSLDWVSPATPMLPQTLHLMGHRGTASLVIVVALFLFFLAMSAYLTQWSRLRRKPRELPIARVAIITAAVGLLLVMISFTEGLPIFTKGLRQYDFATTLPEFLAAVGMAIVTVMALLSIAHTPTSARAIWKCLCVGIAYCLGLAAFVVNYQYPTMSSVMVIVSAVTFLALLIELTAQLSGDAGVFESPPGFLYPYPFTIALAVYIAL